MDMDEEITSCFFCEKIIPLEEVNYAHFRYRGTEKVLREIICDDCLLENAGVDMGGGTA